MTSIEINRTDGLSSATAIKGPCRVATTANITLSGLQTIDGTSLVVDDRVLVKNQTDQTLNGIWVVSNSAWRRAKDFSRNRDIKNGTLVWVSGGDNGPALYAVTSADPIVIGTSNITFALATQVIGFDGPLVVASRTLLKAVNTSQRTVVDLTESGREGRFKWTLGNFSTHIAADTQEGIYVKADDVAATAGAWVRETDGRWYWPWFGITAQSIGGTDQAPAINAFMAIANIVEPWHVFTGPGLFPCNSRITTPTFQLSLEGTLSGDQQTILYKRTYNEGTTGRGLISAVTHGIQLRNIVFSAGSGSGGALVSIITNGTSMVGDTLIDNCNLSGGDFVNYSLYVDGQLNSGSTLGVRDMRVTNTTIFGAANASYYIIAVRAHWNTGCNILTSGGSGVLALAVGGVAAVYSDLVQISGGGISGQISLDKTLSGEIDIVKLGANVSNTSDVTNFTIRAGSYVAGTLEHDWTGDSRYEIGRAYQDRAAGYLATVASNVTGAGGTPHTIIFDTLSLGLAGWDGTQNYNTSNGRYTAKYTGDHHFELEVCLTGITSVHTSYILKSELYTSGGVQIHSGTRQRVGNAFAQADGNGRLSIPMSCDINMSATDYVIFTIFVEEVGGAGSAVVDVRGSTSTERWTRFEARLAA